MAIQDGRQWTKLSFCKCILRCRIPINLMSYIGIGGPVTLKKQQQQNKQFCRTNNVSFHKYQKAPVVLWLARGALTPPARVRSPARACSGVIGCTTLECHVFREGR